MAKTGKKGFVLGPNATVDEAIEALQNGDLTREQYAEWDRARMQRLKGKPSKGGGGGNKTTCPLTTKDFLAKATPINLEVDGQVVSLAPRQFGKDGDAERSFGWGYSGKIDKKVGDKSVKLQSSINLVVVGSKYVN